MSNPHDRFFKAVFGQREHAVDHFQRFLPSKMVGALDLAGTESVPGSFVDEALTERLSDLLFRIPLRHAPEGGPSESFIYLLFEHQSTVDDMMAFRLLRYMTRIWDRWLGEHPTAKRLPVVVPLVLYQGPRPWTAVTEFGGLFTLPHARGEAFASCVPQFEMVLNDLSQVDDEALRQGAMAGIGRLLLKHIRDPDLEDKLSDLLDSLSAGAIGVLKAVALVVEYVLQASEVSDVTLARILEHKAGPRAGEIAMTTAEKLLQQGRLEGRAEGREEGRLRKARGVVLRLVELRFGEASEAVAAHVGAASEVQLDRWTERLLEASSVNEALELEAE